MMVLVLVVLHVGIAWRTWLLAKILTQNRRVARSDPRSSEKCHGAAGSGSDNEEFFSSVCPTKPQPEVHEHACKPTTM